MALCCPAHSYMPLNDTTADIDPSSFTCAVTGTSKDEVEVA
jgi:hypothetical protein